MCVCVRERERESEREGESAVAVVDRGGGTYALSSETVITGVDKFGNVL